jgi:hypothetical protein
MTDPRVAALAVDLGLKLGSDLVARRRRPGEPVKALPWSKDGAGGEGSAPVPATPLVPHETDDLVEYTPTAMDYRKAQKLAGWRAVYICGPESAVPTVIQGLELWPCCIGTTASPRDIKRIAQLWNWHSIAMHEVLWCESAVLAESLKTMLVDALDFRHHHLSFRWYSLEPVKIVALAGEVARTARIAVFDEGERQRRLSEAVTKLNQAVKRIVSGGR